MYENELFTGKRYRMGYVFDACPDSDWLIVTFSAVAPKNSPVKHHYSFGHSLSNYHVSKLYLQDTPGEEGCYYLCTGLDFGVADTVCDLILNICKKNRIPLSHVITPDPHRYLCTTDPQIDFRVHGRRPRSRHGAENTG